MLLLLVDYINVLSVLSVLRWLHCERMPDLFYFLQAITSELCYLKNSAGSSVDLNVLTAYKIAGYSHRGY